MYFKSFPRIVYEFDDGTTQQKKVVVDITKNVRIKKELIDNISNYEYYRINDGESLDLISELFYGTPNYYWILMLANDILDYRYDFPMTDSDLEKYINDKYDNPEAIKHYEDDNGVIVPSDTALAKAVSYRDYEENLNEEKRKIKIPSSSSVAKLSNSLQLL